MVLCVSQKSIYAHTMTLVSTYIHTCQKTVEFPSQPMSTEQALHSHYTLGANCRNPQVYSDSFKCGKSDLHSWWLLKLLLLLLLCYDRCTYLPVEVRGHFVTSVLSFTFMCVPGIEFKTLGLYNKGFYPELSCKPCDVFFRPYELICSYDEPQAPHTFHMEKEGRQTQRGL